MDDLQQQKQQGNQNNQVQGNSQLTYEQSIIKEKINTVNGDLIIKEYARGKMLGKGGFAKCFEFTNQETKKISAAKIIPKQTLQKSRSRQKLISEIKIHKSLHNPNIVGFEHVFEDQEAVYILLELCPNQTLNELLKRRKRIHELEVQCYLVQIIQAIKYLHQNRVIHRDLKLGNLFLGQNLEIKVGDFGLATRLEFDSEKKRTICGTPNYIAPEILDDKTGHSYPVDIWSLGVIIYTLIIGKPPFETPEVKTTYRKIKQNNYNFPDSVPISDNAKDLIKKILVTNPDERPSLNDILEHPFLTSNPIPKTLPISSFTCGLPSKYIQSFNTGGMNPYSSTDKMLKTLPNTTQTNVNNIKLSTNNLDFNNFNQTQQTQSQLTVRQNNFLTPETQGTDTGRGIQTKRESNTGQISLQQQQQQSQQLMSNHNGYGLANLNQQGPSLGVSLVQWVDYSSKYGLGYVLSNGCAGVFFNDSTKLILDPILNQFEYIQRRPSDKVDESSKHSLDDYPQELKKKVTLLLHFKGYLEGEKQKVQGSTNGGISVNALGQPYSPIEYPMIYVKKWMKTSYAVLFRLSNKVVQVIFTDKTEIQLSSENKQVIYTNKKGQKIHYPLPSALESEDTEMAKRLRYTKEILTHIFQSQQNSKKSSNQPGVPNTGALIDENPTND